MNPANPNPPAQGQQEQPQRPNVLKMVLMYMVMQWVFGNFFGGNKGQQGASGPVKIYPNLFSNDEPLEFEMFISNNKTFDNSSTSVWQEKDLKYNFDKENYREKTLEFNVDELLSSPNVSLFAHFVLSSLRTEASENYTEVHEYLTQVSTINLTEWRKKDANLDQENLLFAEEKNKSSAAELQNLTKEGNKLPHLRSKVWIQLIHDTNAYPQGQLPAELAPQFINSTNGMSFYLPIVDVSQFWARKKDFVLIDPEAENKTLNTTFYFDTYWIYKYMLESQMKKSGSMYEEWGVTDNMDEVKEMVMEANPYLFAVTIVVSMLHSLFEFLAIKNEIAFWKNLESHKGLSLRSLWVSLVTEVIVLLYLMDNDTSFLILISTFASLGVTVWKIIKTTKFTRKATFPFVELDYQDAYKTTTQEYDQVASKYLGWILVPLLAGYTIYSLLYEKHKGWYSFVVQTLVGFIYVFGFIEMTPQLYINYKLKSVEHLPWRVLIYKFLNTIVDDLFAFVITMPWLKRLSCFRDDIIFLIYLYQRWIYRVDKTRDPYGTEKKDGAEPVAEGEKKETKAITTGTVKKRMGGSGQNVTQRNTGNQSAQETGNNGNAPSTDNKKTN